MAEILVLFHSRNGATESLARAVARGVDSVDGFSPESRVGAAAALVLHVGGVLPQLVQIGPRLLFGGV